MDELYLEIAASLSANIIFEISIKDFCVGLFYFLKLSVCFGANDFDQCRLISTDSLHCLSQLSCSVLSWASRKSLHQSSKILSSNLVESIIHVLAVEPFVVFGNLKSLGVRAVAENLDDIILVDTNSLLIRFKLL